MGEKMILYDLARGDCPDTCCNVVEGSGLGTAAQTLLHDTVQIISETQQETSDLAESLISLNLQQQCSISA